MNIEKLKNLYSACPDKYGAAQAMGTTYQALYNIIYNGSVCRVDLLQRIAQYFNVPVGYFFDEVDKVPESASPSEEFASKLEALQKENVRLREELRIKAGPELPKKSAEVYRLWLEYMRLSEQRNQISDQMRELYQDE